MSMDRFKVTIRHGTGWVDWRWINESPCSIEEDGKRIRFRLFGKTFTIRY